MNTLVLKIKLYPDSIANRAFTETCEAYSNACNFVSKYVFDTDQMFRSPITIHKQMYHEVRKSLKSQMSCSVFRTVKSAYETVNTQLKNKPYSFKCDGVRYSFKRNLSWLQKPILFNKPFADLTRNKDWSFVTKDGEVKLSINTLGKRIVVPFNHHFDDILFSHELGNAKLIKRKGIWYLHITYKVETVEPLFERVVGHDRG